MSGKLSLLNDSSDSEIELTVNKDYANSYNHWRNKEELQKYKDLKKEDDESESSSESEEEAPEFDEEFFRALSLLKGKDPRIYDKNFELFKKKEMAPKPKTEKKKPMFMKDYERTLVLERGGKFSDEEDDDLAVEVPTYNEEQEDLKKSFKEAFKDSDDSDADDLLQVRTKTKKEQEEEEVDYIKWLKGEEKEVSEDVKKDMSYLRSYWNDPTLDEGEKFLRDYILNKKYLEKDDSEIPTYEEITSGMLSDDEKMIEEQEKFEHKYNFRFEEPDEEFIKRYPRTIGESLRRVDTRRKLKRDEKIERKRKEREQRKEELKRLKALKRKEIEEKFLKLKEISGQDEINLNESDMESDFDPDKHDQKMRDMFNDEYYQVEEDQKPEFPYDEELDAENWNTWAGEKIVDDEDESVSVQEESIEDIQDEKPTTSSAKSDFANEMINASRPKKRVKKKSLFAKIISQSKPVYDPDGKSFEEYLDEYYKLDYEDIVGDMPVRYKYRKVIPNDFGLTVDEILAADERELNRWCSVKKTCQYRNDEEELYDVQAFRKKSENHGIKKKILQSVYAPKDEDSAIEDFKLMKQQGKDISNSDSSSKALSEKKDCITDAPKENDSHKISICNSTEDEVSDFTQNVVSDNKPSKVQQTVDEQNFTPHTSKKKKKKQKQNLDAQGEPVKLMGVNGTYSAKLSSLSEENQEFAKRKRRHDDDDSVNSSAEVSETVASISNTVSEDSVKKTLKKKKKQKRNSDSQEESERLGGVNRTSSTELPNLSEENQKFAKRKREHDDDDDDDDSVNSSAEVSETVTSTSNTVSEDPVGKTSKKKKKKRKKKQVSQDTSNSNATVSQCKESNSHHKKLKNKPKNSTSESINNILGLSDARLAAYGINPKKFKNKMKYGKM